MMVGLELSTEAGIKALGRFNRPLSPSHRALELAADSLHCRRPLQGRIDSPGFFLFWTPLVDELLFQDDLELDG